MNTERKRKICFVITSKIHYGRSKLILEELRRREDIELQIVVGASAILPNYGDVLSLLEQDGFSCDAKITMTVEGGTSVSMAKTAGLGIVEFATAFDNLQPDIVVLRADRYEVLAAAIAAAYLNITVAHIEGGDISGTIDESVRHAITKISHIHFPTNEAALNRIIKMGENPAYVHNFGCPGVEFAVENMNNISSDIINAMGVGDIVDIEKPFLVVMQHPVTTEIQNNRKNTRETLKAIQYVDIPTIWFWPNVDAGTDEVSKAIRVFREIENPKNIRFLKYIRAEDFNALIDKSVCLIGNSSAGIKEASYLGTPVVNVGTRQNGRMRGHNVLDVNYDQDEIKKAIDIQIKHGKFSSSDMYYKPGTSKNIVDMLASAQLYTQKFFFEKE